jgi:predicted kinase
VGTVHAIHGYLGVGKTTFARRLEAETGGVLLSIDSWTIGLSGDDKHLDAALFERAWALLSEPWPRIVRTGADVILDFGFWSRQSRDDVRVRAAAAAAPLRLYSLHCDRATAIARCQARVREHSYDLDADTYDALRAKFEPLAVDEAAEIVNTEG